MTKALTTMATSVITLLILGVGFCYPQTTALEMHMMGLEYSVQGRFGEARHHFGRALRVDPFFESARTALGLIESVENRTVARETAIHHFKADRYIIQEQWDDAIRECNKATEISPKFATAYIDRGFAYVGKGEYDQAISDFNKAIEIDAMVSGSYLSRGFVYAYKNEYDRAIADFNKAIDLDPNQAMGYYSRGLAYQGKGAYDEAIADFNKAIDLNPNEAIFYHNRGAAWYRKGNYQQAVADYTKAIEMKPNHPAEAIPEAEPLQTLASKKDMTSESGFEPMPRLDTIKVPIANIRAKPTTDSPVIAKLKMGTDVTLLHQDDAWYAVKLLDGQLGWAHQSLFVESE